MDTTTPPLAADELMLVDKPAGISSFGVVARVRHQLSDQAGTISIKGKDGIIREKRRKIKVGHAGTLDPLATGVMVLCTGRATKRIDELQSGVKEYVATIALGATTPSFDLETEIDATYPTEHITRELTEECLKKFTGRIEQIPPAFSACKVDGKRAYKLARKGHDVELKPKILVIDSIELLSFAPTEIQIRVVCSKGTYIRALARDIGRALGSGGHLTALRRTRIGQIGIDECMTVDEAAELIRTTEIETYDEED